MARILYGIKSLAGALTHNLLGMAAGLFGFPTGGYPAFGREIRNRFAGLTDRVFLAVSGYISAAQNAARLFTATSAPAIGDIPRNPNLPVGTAYQAAVSVSTPGPTYPANPNDIIYATITVPFSRRPRNNFDVEQSLYNVLQIAAESAEVSPSKQIDISQVLNFDVHAIERRGR